jgi:hypothetical protein
MDTVLFAKHGWIVKDSITGKQVQKKRAVIKKKKVKSLMITVHVYIISTSINHLFNLLGLPSIY